MTAVDKGLLVTRHGKKRSRERVGIPKRAVDKNAKTALEKGLRYEDTAGALRRYLDYLYWRGNGAANNMRIYGNHVYLFHGEVLITVLNVPPEHRKQAVMAQRKKCEK